MVILLLSIITILSLSPTRTAEVESAGLDKFGIRKLYATKSGGEEWYINMGNPTSDPRFSPQSAITKNADGSWKITSTQIRLNVKPRREMIKAKLQLIKKRQIKRGYAGLNDWKNVEMTGYVKINSRMIPDDNYAWYNRGGRHTGCGYPEDVKGQDIKEISITLEEHDLPKNSGMLAMYFHQQTATNSIEVNG